MKYAEKISNLPKTKVLFTWEPGRDRTIFFPSLYGDFFKLDKRNKTRRDDLDPAFLSIELHKWLHNFFLLLKIKLLFQIQYLNLTHAWWFIVLATSLACEIKKHKCLRESVYEKSSHLELCNLFRYCCQKCHEYKLVT